MVFNVCLPVYADENAVADISEYYNPDYEEYVKSLQGVSEEEFEKKLLLAPSEYSYNEDYVSDTNMYAARSSYSSTYDSIKDMSFDLKDIDSYPSSGVIGWSFAASDALEIYLRKNCSLDKDDCDFSAISLMSQMSSTKVPDTYAMSDSEFFEGNFAMAAAYWLRNEHSLENENIKVMDTVSLSDLSRWSSEEQSENRINSIKRMIMDYGGVYTKYELFTDAFDQYYSSYNNNNGGEIISGRTIESGVVIIGWDDNYAIDRFGESKPSKPGAFKVLTNRVVESNVGTIHLGTYYISYDMVNFLSDISAVKKAFVGSYAKNTYEYDKKAHSGI